MTPFRALLAWIVLLAVAFMNGALRQFAYPSTLGDFAARQVAAGIGVVALGLVIWFILRRWPTSPAWKAWATGAFWAGLTVAFEVALVRVSGRPWQDVIDQYAFWKGSLWSFLVLWVLMAPAAISSLQRSRVAVGPALGWVVVNWIACGLVFALARALLGVDAAVAIHLVAAPVIGALATLYLWNHPRHPGVAATALTLAGTAASLDVPGYQEMLEMRLPAMPGMKASPGNMVAAQAVKDATMAHFIASRRAPSELFLHFNGVFHSQRGGGIGWFLARADPGLRVATISSVLGDSSAFEQGHGTLGDYVFVVPAS